MKKTAIVKIQMKNPVLPNFTENAMVSNFWTQLTILPRKLNFATTIMLREIFQKLKKIRESFQQFQIILRESFQQFQIILRESFQQFQKILRRSFRAV